MMQTLILLCTLAALIGLPLGYWIGWAHDEASRWLGAYLDGCGAVYVAEWEFWR